MTNMGGMAVLQSLVTLQGLVAIIIGAVIGASLTASLNYHFNRKVDYINRSSRYLSLRKDAYGDFMALRNDAPYQDVQTKGLMVIAYGSAPIRQKLLKILDHEYAQVNETQMKELRKMMIDEISGKAELWDKIAGLTGIDNPGSKKRWQFWR